MNDTQHFAHETPGCPCGAQFGTGHPALCCKCLARLRWTRRHQARGTHGGANKAIRTRRSRRNRNGGAA